ncbi:MAG: glycosyltransferase [Thermodesulfobacteriota bacterium]
MIIVIESMGGGGAQQVVASLLRHWTQMGLEVHLITLRPADTDVFDVPQAVRRQVLGEANSRNFLIALRNNLRRVQALRGALRESGAGVVLSFVTATNVLTILASLWLRCRVIVSERNDPRLQKIPWVWKLLRRVVYPLADFVTANSRAAVATLAEMGVSKRLTWVPNPLRHPNSCDAAKREDGSHVMLAVGRLHHQKGYDILLKAFCVAVPAMAGWRLRILGAGALESELRVLSDQLGIGGRVDFLGYLPDPFPYYKAADLFVMASRYEGSPNALWEAMSCGVPAIVSSNIAGALEIMEHGKSGWIFPCDDVDALAAAMRELAGRHDLRIRLGRAGQQAVQIFADDKVFGIWDELIRAATPVAGNSFPKRVGQGR